MNSKCLVLSAVVSILTVAARGDTLAWFRFEELTGNTGDSLAIGSKFEDSGEGGRVLQLQDFGRKAINPTGATALASKDMKVDDAESERVLYTDGSKSSTLDNVRAVALKGGTKGTNGNDGSVLRILETEQTRLTPQNFTIEFLYRNTKQFPLTGGTWMSFFSRPWKLSLTEDGKESGSGVAICPSAIELVINGNTLQLRYTYIDGTGQVKTTYINNGVVLKAAPPTDSLWHHFAVAVDQTAHTAKVYLDGKLTDTVTLDGDIYWGEWDAAHHDLLAWTFGGNYFGYGISGSMDEIRISDAALAPEDFLTLGYAGQEPVKEGESILYLPFDDPTGTSYATKLYSIAQPELNPPADGALEKVVDTWFQDKYVSFGTTGVGEIVQGVDEGITRGANTGCLHFQVPSGAVTSDFGYTPTAFKFADYGYSKLTIECFFRYDAPAYAVRNGWPDLIRFFKGDGTRVLLCQFTDSSRLRISIGASAVVTTPFRFDDSRWHHLALTIDNTKKVFEYYVDYNIISSGAYTGTFALDENWKLSIGPRSGIKGFTADVDEFRISNGILSRDKMLATRAVPAFPAAVPVAASTKAWYRFEETDLGSGALPVGTVFYNRGNPSILPAEVIAVPRTVDDCASRGTGTFYGPTSVAADGGYIDEGVEAGGPNRRALKFSDSADGAKSGSMLRIGASSTHSLCLQTFTVEFFYQTGGGNNEKFDAKNWTTFFANHNTAGGDAANSTFELRHCGNDTGTTTGNFTVLYRSAANGDKTQVKVTGENWQIPTDGQRHHYAITLDQATHACELFVDHESRGAITLAGDLKYADNFDNGQGSDQHWYVGGNYYGFTRSGTFDEFRFSDKVLTPAEMLRTGSGPVDEGGTIAYLPLDSDLSSFVGNNPYADDATLAANAAKFESGDAGFAEGVKAFRVCNAPKGRGHNSATLALDGRSGHDCQIFYPLYAQNLARFGYKKLTCEFFFKGSCVGAWENIVGLRSAKSAAKWAFLLQHGAGSTVTFRTDTDKVTSTVPATVPNADIFDGKWHHVAVTIDGETVPGKTQFACFFDYQQVGKTTDVDGSATGSFFTETACIDFGTPSGQAGLKCQIDELRLSAGVLEPEDFLGMEGGFRIMVR